jgi:aspartyl-tRNA(Asn)/glutamyl-tRNA(Gln) amidotransferase subunit A
MLLITNSVLLCDLRGYSRQRTVRTAQRYTRDFMPDSILNLSVAFRKRTLSPLDVLRDCLTRIEKLNPALNAFITVTADIALSQARQAEAEIACGQWRGPLHGIPIGLKDLIDTAGVPTTAASALFKDRVPAEDAEVVRRLKQAGAVLIGKQNLHELAYGGSSIISHYGEVHNPWNLDHIAGGSSGGSAAAVAAGLGFAAIGTDTAGSIREPAAQCGVVGLKSTYGRVSCRGVIPLSWSFDHVGPITRTVSDAAVILQAIAGHDPRDRASVDSNVADYPAAVLGTEKLRIGIPRSFFYEELDTEVATATEEAMRVLTTLSSELREVSLEVPEDRRLQTAEAYAFHADNVSRTPDLYCPETLRRIRAGENVSEAEVVAERNELQAARQRIRSVFETIDLLVTPTTPVAAPAIAGLRADMDGLRRRELVLLRNTRPFNVWGLPAISIPCGFTRAGLPIGLQIAGAPWMEALVLRLAYAYEQATEWHKKAPPV